METIELFGNIYEIVPDNGDTGTGCNVCDLKHICNLTKPNIPCKKQDGTFNRHFEIILNF